MLTKVVASLRKYPFALIKFPDLEECVEYAAMIRNREPIIEKAIGFVDGLALHVMCSSDEEAQSKHYSGWKSDTFVNNILMLALTGKITFAVINAPGSWHDASTATPLYARLHELQGYYVLADSAFPKGGDLSEQIMTPLKDTVENLSDDQRVIHNAVTSLRQSAEWGMRGLQSSFGRLKQILGYDSNFNRNLIIPFFTL